MKFPFYMDVDSTKIIFKEEYYGGEYNKYKTCGVFFSSSANNRYSIDLTVDATEAQPHVAFLFVR